MLTTDLTALEALGLAVRREMDAARAYHELASRCTHPLATERFRLLEKEARHHEAMLRARHAELAPGVDLVVPRSSGEVPVPQVGSVPACEGLRAALRYAVDAAQRAREFYLEAAGAATDLTGRAMLRYLADVYARHRMELESEYDLVVRYPHAYDDPESPWRPEAQRSHS
jgi:rubrerythrin